MERDFFSQPLNRRTPKSIYHSQPVQECIDGLDRSIDSFQTSRSAEPTEIGETHRVDNPSPSVVQLKLKSDKPESNISELCDTFKSLSDELTVSLQEYKSEKTSLENELNRLNQENDFIKLELDRQKKHIEELSETSVNLSEKLNKEETETKRIFELKFLEIQDLFGKIEANDKGIVDFKKSFSKSIVEAEAFSKNIKEELKNLVENSSKANSDFLNDFSCYTNNYIEEVDSQKKKIADLDSSVGRGIAAVKEKRIKEAQFLHELDTVLQEIEVEQKRRNDLESSLNNLRGNISKMNMDHKSQQDLWGKEIKELTSINSQLTLKNAALDHDISLSENDLQNLKERYNEKTTDIDSLQAVLVKKRLEDEKIQQEIESLEKQANGLQNDYDTAISDIESKKHVELELKELESEMLDLVKKCNDLEEARLRIMEASPLDRIKAEEENIETLQSNKEQLLQKVNEAKKQLDDKHSELNSVQQNIQNLRQIYY